METEIGRLYGNKVRVRACGLCWQGENLLMVRHRYLAGNGLWTPPGGGLEFGEPVEERLRKEFAEETGLVVTSERFQFACEFIQDPLHAIELFFQVRVTGGSLQQGNDPELPIIQEVRFLSPAEISIIPSTNLHGIFRLIASPGDLKSLSGFFRI